MLQLFDIQILRLLGLILFAIFSQTQAKAVTIVKQAPENVVASGSCAEVRETVSLFANSNPSIKIMPALTKTKTNLCESNIAGLLPKVYSESENDPWNDSSNCVGFAFAAKGIVPTLRFVWYKGHFDDNGNSVTDYDEREFYLNSPLCTKVDSPQPGDLGAIRTTHPHWGEVGHIFIYLSPTLRYSKNALADDEIRFETGTDILGYDRKDHFIDYWRCESMSSYLNKINASRAQLNLYASVSELSLFVKNNFFRPSSFDQTMDVTAKVFSKVRNLEKQIDAIGNKADTFFASAMKLQLNRLKDEAVSYRKSILY